jgi:integrase
MKLSATSVKSLILPPGVKDKTFWDDELGGFGVRLRAGGSARYVIQYDVGGKSKRLTLDPKLFDFGKARTKAKDLLAHVRLGGDPSAEKRQAQARAAETFGVLLERYLPYKRTKAKGGQSRSFKEVERHLRRYARPLHGRPITTIERRDIAALMSAITTKAGPVAANCLLGSLSAYFVWLQGEGLLEVNPASGVNKAVTNGSRARVLSLGEFREIWSALGDSDYDDIIRLLAWTVARKSEIGGLREEGEIDFDKAELNLPASRTRNNRPRTIPLTAPALALLKARPRTGREFMFGTGRGFSGWGWAKKALDGKVAANRKAAGITAPMESWCVHDLRRFFATQAGDVLAIQPHLIEVALGHVAAFRSGVSGTYNRASYGAEHRRVLERWAQLLEDVVSGKRPAAATVVRLRKRR